MISLSRLYFSKYRILPKPPHFSLDMGTQTVNIHEENLRPKLLLLDLWRPLLMKPLFSGKFPDFAANASTRPDGVR
jgi:hypothetical protein